MSGVLISPSDLCAKVAEGQVRLLDVRWALGDPEGAQQYSAGHIPGAVFVDLDIELAAPPSPARGRHPLPDLGYLQQCARGWGIHRGDAVVVYDATGGLAAARAWWLLRWGGIADVRILDGGLPAWIAAGQPVATGAEAETPRGDVVLTAGNLPVIDADAAADWPGALLDARAAERFRGETEPIDPRAGHIPGAVSVPTAENLDSDGRFRPLDDLRERFAGLDGPVAVYCGSGVTATHQIAALAVVGIEAALYPGSWSQWAHDLERPVATGG